MDTLLVFITSIVPILYVRMVLAVIVSRLD